MAEQEKVSVEGLMELVSEFGQCRWSEGSYGASYIAKAHERMEREQAADLYAAIRSYAQRLAEVPQGWKVVPVEPTAIEIEHARRIVTAARHAYELAKMVSLTEGGPAWEKYKELEHAIWALSENADASPEAKKEMP